MEMTRKIGVYIASTFQVFGDYHSVQVADSFARRYYNTLCHSPQNIYQLYKDESILSRLGDHGMRSITTIKEIEKEIALSITTSTTIILFAIHAQETIGKSIIVGVTGLLTKDGMSKGFSQNLLLAPQPRGFYVKNDFLWFTDMSHLVPIVEYNVVSMEENDTSREEDVDALNQIESSTVVPSLAFEQILENNSSNIVPATTESSTVIQAREAKMILVRDLPRQINRKSLALALKDFGPVKYRNIQIRKYNDGYHYAIVEFNSPRAANQAVQAGSISLDGRECFVDPKKAQIN
ncbi:putative Ras GTPase-activating protein-binding protein [Helianthus anomalus]